MAPPRWLALILTLLLGAAAPAALPPPPADLVDWPMKWSPDDPGALSADNLIDKPAAKNGPITIRDAHFYSGDARVRFWGVNFAFSANFPTHEQADAVAHRLPRFGINAVRFHHMDNQPFPNGIFADRELEKRVRSFCIEGRRGRVLHLLHVRRSARKPVKI